MQPRILAIVGVGLIGGSVGLAVRRRGAVRVFGVDRDAAALRCAKERGLLDEGYTHVGAAVAAADLVLVCTPVDTVAEQILSAAAVCPPGTVLTDAGSTKAAIVHTVQNQLAQNISFVGGHPLAGSEKQGPENADPDLFRGRVVVLTPTSSTDREAVSRVSTFWESLGARIQLMSPEAHDHALATTSHLPHLVASALAGVLPPELAQLVATGFRDTTRIAAGDLSLWSAIFDVNRAEILHALERFEAQLQGFRQALEQGDREAVRMLLAAGRASRLALDRA